MLVLTARKGSVVHIGDSITIHIGHVEGGKVSIGYDVPDDVQILREEAKKREPRPR